MRAAWMGQGGVYLEAGETRIMIDPYFSDSLGRTGGAEMTRRVAVDPEFAARALDVLVLTHSHQDHADWETLDVLLAAQPAPIHVLAPLNVWAEARKRYGGGHDYVMFDQGVEITVKAALLRSIPAVHSDERAVGVEVSGGGARVYVTGDTLYSRRLAPTVDRPVDCMFVTMNGKGNNMNAVDAARLTREIAPRLAVPVHWDMFSGAGADPGEFLRLMADGPTRAFLAEQYALMDMVGGCGNENHGCADNRG